MHYSRLILGEVHAEKDSIQKERREKASTNWWASEDG